MKYFLDTANLSEIRDAFETGVIAGVTTNPSLLSKEPKANFYEHIKNIAALCEANGSVPLSVEVFAKEASEMFRQALEIREKIGYDNLNIKIPVGYEELKVIHKLATEKVAVNCTCCFTDVQMQMATQAGARYVSLFYNRLIDAGGNPNVVLSNTRRFLDSNRLHCEIIAGSIRNPYDLNAAWNSGAHIVTAGHNILTKTPQHLKTDESVEGFLNDFAKWMD